VSSISLDPLSQTDDTVKALVKRLNDSRERSESFSSVSTDVSGNVESGTSSVASVTTNATTPYPLSSSTTGDKLVPSSSPRMPVRPTENLRSLSSNSDHVTTDASVSTTDVLRSLTGRPTLDLRSISNHAEAEDLVKRTQEEILESAGLREDDPKSPGIPLSAQLAAYGEILALERRFARGERQRRQWSTSGDSEDEAEFGTFGSEEFVKPNSGSHMRHDSGSKRLEDIPVIQKSLKL